MNTRKTPVSGTGEWAAHGVNIQRHCEHDCLYCYAKTNAILRFKTSTADSWKTPEIDPIQVGKKRRKLDGTVMFPTQHDITPANLADCITVLKKLLEVGNKVLIVSKPHLDCVRGLCYALKGYEKQVLFRFTIGSGKNDVLKKWEPNAPTFEERMEALKFACRHGWSTSVSCEPMLDQRIFLVINYVRPYVTDAIWLGKPNKITRRIVTNNPDLPNAEAMAGELEAMFPDDFIWDLYDRYKDDPMIKWKDSIKAIVGLERSMVKGLDR